MLIFCCSFDNVVKFFKENQTGFEEGMAFNMGQLLSIPFVILGVILIVKSLKPKSQEEIKKPAK